MAVNEGTVTFAVFQGTTQIGGSVTSSAVVAVFDGRTGGILPSYFAYDAGFTGGVLVAAGDVRGAGVAQVLTGAGAGGGPAVEEIDALSGARLAAFFAYPHNMTAGVRVGLGRAISDNRLILLTGQGAQATTFATGFDGLTQAQIDQFFLAPGA